MGSNHHMAKPVMIGEVGADGQFNIVYQSKALMFASDRRPESRLCCQIVMTDELDGATLRLPETQP